MEGKNAVVISWPRSSKPKLSASRKTYLSKERFLLYNVDAWSYQMWVEDTFDVLMKTREKYESIAVFGRFTDIFYYIHGQADCFWKVCEKKRILVFPPRDLSKLRFDSSKLASNAHAGSEAGGNYQLNMFNRSLDQNRC